MPPELGAGAPARRPRPPRHRDRRGLDARRRAGDRRGVPAVDQRPEPGQPPRRRRPVPRLGVHEPARPVRPAARAPARRAGARRTPPTPRRRSTTSGPTSSCARSSPSGRWSRPRRAGVPFDVLFPNAYLLPAPGIPPIGLGLAPARGMSGRARDRLITSITQRQWDKGVADVNTLRASYGLAPLRSFFDQVHRARRELVLTSAGFDFPGDVPANARYVGAVLDDPGWAAPSRGSARRPTVARSCWSPCRRRSRTRSPACSASSTPWRRCRCTRS